MQRNRGLDPSFPPATGISMAWRFQSPPSNSSSPRCRCSSTGWSSATSSTMNPPQAVRGPRYVVKKKGIEPDVAPAHREANSGVVKALLGKGS